MSTSLTDRLRASPTSAIMLEAADYIDGLISQHHRDSKELRRLCAERDEARQSALDRGFALLKAQKEARALLAERDALRESQQWQPIETAPKDGTEVIVYHPEAGVCAAFCPADGFAWHCMDGQNTVVGTKSGRSIPRMTSFISPPTHWMPMPEAPRAALAQEQS
ncbi:hypothetical protein [Pusillimonas noertemannii]|uniref:hypothetical protein n=1 Tax=Pusillimonas noertemannii TaxID=305977 RepID=UPI000E30501D|nr:hypothetical protein [Pusillimonas noertemannii]NYT67931.1 hypothetical protein [Pusillimonas noertemannii]TFL11926.1 hypothetical protein CSC72_01990 [Pusillimonas noertemannii]